MSKYALVINHELCWGCKTCEVACKQEFATPDGVKLITVEEVGPAMVGDKLDFVYHVSVCRHCDEPPCVDACADEAIAKRDDGIVILDEQRCTGCQLCVDACPYGAIAYDPFNYVGQKCNLCHHRIDQGLYPACADNVCLAHCIHLKLV
jgi:Fe-S-cluster-containing dehydrogenase component